MKAGSKTISIAKEEEKGSLLIEIKKREHKYRLWQQEEKT
jgi:hypothetical protein